jgi:hypothetical protein
MIMKSVLFFILTIFTFNSCIDPYSIELEGENRILTVDGLISTAAGPHEVRLTWTSKYDDQSQGNVIIASGLKVAIVDSDGNVVVLEEEVIDSVTFLSNGNLVTAPLRRKSGIYLTPPDFKAEYDKKYSLLITTNIGEEYASLPEKVIKGTQLDSAVFRPFNEATINPLIDQSGFVVDAYFNDDPAANNFYLWKPSNAWGVLKTFPELFRNRQTWQLEPISCCSRCFLPETRMNGSFTVTNDRLFNGADARFPALFIQDDGFRFMERYRVTLDQYSISEGGYNFLKLVSQQLSIQGSVFDPLPANIRGNMLNLDNPAEQVLGYFFVTDVSSQTIYMNRTDLPIPIRKPIALIYNDCRTFYFSRFTRIGVEPPEGWEDN